MLSLRRERAAAGTMWVCLQFSSAHLRRAPLWLPHTWFHPACVCSDEGNYVISIWGIVFFDSLPADSPTASLCHLPLFHSLRSISFHPVAAGNGCDSAMPVSVFYLINCFFVGAKESSEGVDEGRGEMEALGVQESCWASLVRLKADRLVLEYTRALSRGRKTWHFAL